MMIKVLLAICSLLFPLAIDASKGSPTFTRYPNMGASKTIHQIITNERRFVVFNSRQLTGECREF